jgi:hypothetical protein
MAIEVKQFVFKNKKRTMSHVFHLVDGKYNKEDLLMELQKRGTDFTRVEEIISFNKYLLETPIHSNNQYVLHFA